MSISKVILISADTFSIHLYKSQIDFQNDLKKTHDDWVTMIEAEERALTLLYNLDSYVAPHFNGVSCPDPAVQYCLDQANWHVHQAQELLEAAVLNPRTQYDDGREFYRNLARVLPLMVLAQSFGSPPTDQEEVESSPGTPTSVLSSQDIFEPDTPPLSPRSGQP